MCGDKTSDKELVLVDTRERKKENNNKALYFVLPVVFRKLVES